MGHQLVGRNSVPLEGFGGLITIANPADLPENASPRNWDVDFTIGGFHQRAGTFAALTVSLPINFLFAKTFIQPSGQINSLAQGSNGNIYSENVNTAPAALGLVFSGIDSSANMFSTSDSNREYMCFSQLTDPTIQGDIPRQWPGPGPSQAFFDRISQVAPGVPPAFISSLSAGSSAVITAWSITSGIVTFTAVNSFTAGEIVTVSGLITGAFLNGKTFTVSGLGLSGTQFQVNFQHVNASATESGTATPQYSYPLSSISQPTKQLIYNAMVWAAGPGSTGQGNTVTVYYGNVAGGNPGELGQGQDPILSANFQSGIPVYVFMSDAQFGNGTQLVTGIGQGVPPGGSEPSWYFTFSMPTTGYINTGQPNPAYAHYEITVATVVSTAPIPNLGVGDQIQITGASPSGWDSTWTITQSRSGFTLSVTSDSVSASIAKYYYSYVSGGNFGAQPTPGQLVGQLVNVTGTLNGGGIFNVVDATIASNNTDGGGQFFTIANFPVTTVLSASETNSTATTSGTLFQIDPGAQNYGTAINPIFGNSTTGFASIVGGNSSQFPIAAGTRQAVCLFVTRNGAVTPASTPTTFNTLAQTNYIFAVNIPIGPPDVIARIIAITEAGANGIPGAYFYYIPTPVKSVLNNATITYSSTVIQDNTTTSMKFTFDDFTLLNATEIDVTGLDYFNTVELGNSGWDISYGNRMFYGLVQNKVYNFTNMSFDGGYIATGTANVLPAGWGIDVGSNPAAGNPATITTFQITANVVTFQAVNSFAAGQSVTITGLSIGTYLNGQVLTVSATGLSGTQFQAAFIHANVGSTADVGSAVPNNIPGTLLNPTQYSYGNSYYVKNMTSATQAVYGMITQSAYQDAYQVNILNPQVTYGVRVTCRCPAGQQTGNLVIDLTTNNTATYGYTGYNVQFGVTYEGFLVPFSSMSQTQWKTFNGGLLTVPFQTQVPTTLLLRAWAQNIPYLGDVEIKKIEIFPLMQPIGFPQDAIGVIGSYANKPESFDIITGVISLSQGNQQQVYGAAEFNDILYFLKEESIVSTSSTAGQEPGAWAVHPVTDKAGACGIYAYDKAKEYVVSACREGVFIFNGGEPQFINWEIRDLWNAINWSAGRTIWVKNDIVNHKIYVGVPLPTPNKWLPNAPINANPTTPNVILVCNYLGLETFNELGGEAAMHVTMFGALADLDMRRKWTIWNIPAPNGAFLTRANIINKPFFVCAGDLSGNVYGFSDTQFTDNGAQINWDYCTYGFVNPAKAKENPLLGFHRKRYTKMQVTATSNGAPSSLLNINILIDDIVSPIATFNVWNKPKLTAVELDYVRNLNIAGNRAFIELSSGGLGTSANISRVILVGNADLHGPMPQVPGR